MTKVIMLLKVSLPIKENIDVRNNPIAIIINNILYKIVFSTFPLNFMAIIISTSTIKATNKIIVIGTLLINRSIITATINIVFKNNGLLLIKVFAFMFSLPF